MTSNNKIILVYGGTGHYGQTIVKKLIQKEQSVRVVTRDINKAKEIFGNKVEILQGDVTNRQTVIKSLENVSSIVISLSTASSKQFKKMKQIERDAVLTIMDEASKAKVSRLVYMSVYELREQLLNDLSIRKFGEIKLEIESEIRKSGFNWTIIGNPPSFEIFFAFTRKGKMTVPGGGKHQIPSVSPQDVGEIVSQAVLRDDLSKQRIKLTCPEAYSFPEVAQKMTELSGKRIKHVTIPLVILNAVSFLLIPIIPFVRYLYMSLLLLNNFPPDLAKNVPNEHRKLRELFKYEPVTLDLEIQSRIKENKI